MSDPFADLAGKTGKRFWRGLNELLDRADIRKRLAAEFPALASSAADWRRRDILKCMGAALAMAGLDGCERQPDEDALPYVEQPEGEVPGIARYYATAVELDGVAQPVIGKTRMARPIKLEGHPDHPASGGATDAFTQAALLGLYDPDRSSAPRKRGAITSWADYDAAVAKARADLDAKQGAGFRMLTGPVGSPTLRRQIAALLARWPEARWHVWSPIVQGPARRLDDRHVVVAFDDDLIGSGPLQTYHAKGWATRRRAYQAGDGQALLFVAECSPTITGVTATDRLPARADRIAALLTALGGEPVSLTSRERDWVRRAGAALDRAPGKGLVTVGAHQPPEVRRLTDAINARLGNPVGHRTDDGSDLPSLIADMRGGKVGTLLMLETNPAYTSPEFAAALDVVPMRLHAGLHVDETAARSHWHVPIAHHLEMWSDGTAADGSAVLVQPLVRPWLDVRSRHAVLAGLVGEPIEGQVRATWASLDDAAWRKALLAGSLPSTVTPPLIRGSAGLAAAGKSGTPDPVRGDDNAKRGLALIIRPDPCVWDGSLATNPWLQELPKPLSKITWGSAIHVSPALAAEMELENGDVARLSVGDRSVSGPVWILPGQERHTILVHLGHGRRAGGRVAEGVGFDAWPLVGAAGLIGLDKIGGREEIASTQSHFAMEGDEFVRFVATAADKLPNAPPAASFFPKQRSRPAWGMAIDLDLCIGCNACVVACVAENNIPMVGKEQVAKGREMQWLRIDRYHEGPLDNPTHSFQPVPCMHCEDAPCEMGCPVNATVHSPDGLNLQVYNRCIGTRTCSAYCPYKVRRFNWFDLTAKDPPELQAARNPEVTVRGRGVMEKCTYCIQRISAARIAAKKEDRAIGDGEVVTACQAACPTQAIVFGDVSEPANAVTKRKADGRDYGLLPEANTRPRTTYQARIRGGGESA